MADWQNRGIILNVSSMTVMALTGFLVSDPEWNTIQKRHILYIRQTYKLSTRLKMTKKA